MKSNTDQRLVEKVAIVTGAGRGLGRAEAMFLAGAGAKVVVNDLGGAVSGEGVETSVAQTVVEEILARGGTAVANTDNIATMAGGKAVVEAAMDNFGRLDILVNNAGIARPKVIYEMSEEDWDLGACQDFCVLSHTLPTGQGRTYGKERHGAVYG